MTSRKNIALVCDWLTSVGGAEQVLLALHELYPDAPIYTSQYNKKGINWFLDADVRTGWLQAFPSSLRRFLAPLRQFYFRHLNLSEYDVVISVTGAEAKFVKTKSKKGKATHFCYCHVPTQYYWAKYDDYIKDPGFGKLNPLVRFIFKLLVRPLRNADYKAAQCPDYYITISQHAAAEIKTYYKRESKIIYPPVNVATFHNAVENFTTKVGKSQTKPQPSNNTKLKIINFSRQVTWKRLDLAVKSCQRTKDKLTLIGDGPEHKNLVKLADKFNTVTFRPVMPQDQLTKYLANSDAFIFPSLEPFGIAPVEALAAGCPVIALNAGGAKDYIKDGKNGVLFDEQTVDSLAAAIERFKTLKFNRVKVAESAEPFSRDEFNRKIRELIDAD
ncbi:glycosyltransferase [Candidatus Saccharibacteria bacterium]|nr:glycosyltransferase [Candidatus Saccharibacteria bacterium]